MKRELWKPIPSFPDYSASNLGRIRSEERRCSQKRWGPTTRIVPQRILSQRKDRKGYMHVKVQDIGRRVHRLVLEAFSGGCPDGHETRHLDGDPGNNQIENLRWGTQLQNTKDRLRHGTTIRGESHGLAKLTEDRVREIRSSSASNEEFAHKFGMSPHAIWQARVGQTWAHVE